MDICNFNHLTGRIITPESPCYNEFRQVYNQAVDKYPLVIVFCQNETDVKNVICWSRSHGVSLRIRNGGHNYEGYSTGDDVLILDLSEMNHIDIDEVSHRVTVQAGVTNGQMYELMYSRGYPFPGGTCPTVGIGGYALGGGWGLSSRYLGLGCDNLIELSMVNSEGMTITASQFENPELFWALRGGGTGNFGVVTSMVFDLPKKVDKVTYIDIRYEDTDQEKQSIFIQLWQEWLADADPRITLVSRVFHSRQSGPGIIARGIFYGTPESVLGIIAPLLRLGGVKYNLRYLTFLETTRLIGEFYPPSEAFQSVSRFAMRDLQPCECWNLAGMIQELPSGSTYTGLSFYALGGAVSRISPDATAFYYRNARYILWLNTIFECCLQNNASFIADRFCYLQSITQGSYVNFPYQCLPCCLEEYYGNHVCRLKEIKRCYDPCNVFSFPQGLGL